LKNISYYFLGLKAGAYILLPLVLLLLPADFVDKGQSLCISKLLANTECYACGMTRAIMHLIHLDFSGAYKFNKLAFVSFPVLSFLWAQGFLKDFKLLKNQRKLRQQLFT
jgi:hypothetical protein